MNLILLFPEDFIEKDRVRLGGRRLKHVREVHRAKAGDTLTVGFAGERIGTGTVTHICETSLEMIVTLDRKPPDPLPLILILALPRPKVLRRVLRTAAGLGVKRIYLINSFRVEKSFWQTPFLERRAIEKQLILGLEQAKDTVLPDIFLRERFKPFIEDELPGISEGTLKIAAHPGSPEPCPRNPGNPITLAVGPEGGFIAYEIEKLVSTGFAAVGLGARILPVETAVPFLISRLF